MTFFFFFLRSTEKENNRPTEKFWPPPQKQILPPKNNVLVAALLANKNLWETDVLLIVLHKFFLNTAVRDVKRDPGLFRKNHRYEKIKK